MTKRFKLRLSQLGNGMITDTQKREDLYFDKEFLDATLPKANKWLNELGEENERLQQQNKKLQEKIKKERNSFKKTQERYSKEAETKIKELSKENSEYHKIVNCGNCHFHNYDWYDDGDEFEVCDKGNTERLVYHQFCKDWVEL